MENQRVKISKFEEMSGFKEIDSLETIPFHLKFFQKFLLVLKTASEFFDEYVLPLVLGISIIVLMFDLVFLGAYMKYNYFRLILLCVLLFYRYKKGRLY